MDSKESEHPLAMGRSSGVRLSVDERLLARASSCTNMIPWLERMGWGREAAVGATLGGEPLGRTQGAAESRESSMIFFSELFSFDLTSLAF